MISTSSGAGGATPPGRTTRRSASPAGASDFGAKASTAQVPLRWLMPGLCASQQPTEQKTSWKRPELQVDTLHL
jgi:hypothetical protein